MESFRRTLDFIVILVLLFGYSNGQGGGMPIGLLGGADMMLGGADMMVDTPFGEMPTMSMLMNMNTQPNTMSHMGQATSGQIPFTDMTGGGMTLNDFINGGITADNILHTANMSPARTVNMGSNINQGRRFTHGGSTLVEGVNVDPVGYLNQGVSARGNSGANNNAVNRGSGFGTTNTFPEQQGMVSKPSSSQRSTHNANINGQINTGGASNQASTDGFVRQIEAFTELGKVGHEVNVPIQKSPTATGSVNNIQSDTSTYNKNVNMPNDRISSGTKALNKLASNAQNQMSSVVKSTPNINKEQFSDIPKIPTKYVIPPPKTNQVQTKSSIPSANSKLNTHSVFNTKRENKKRPNTISVNKDTTSNILNTEVANPTADISSASSTNIKHENIKQRNTMSTNNAASANSKQISTTIPAKDTSSAGTEAGNVINISGTGLATIQIDPANVNFNPGSGLSLEIAALQSALLGTPVDMSGMAPPPFSHAGIQTNMPAPSKSAIPLSNTYSDIPSLSSSNSATQSGGINLEPKIGGRSSSPIMENEFINSQLGITDQFATNKRNAATSHAVSDQQTINNINNAFVKLLSDVPIENEGISNTKATNPSSSYPEQVDNISIIDKFGKSNIGLDYTTNTNANVEHTNPTVNTPVINLKTLPVVELFPNALLIGHGDTTVHTNKNSPFSQLNSETAYVTSDNIASNNLNTVKPSNLDAHVDNQMLNEGLKQNSNTQLYDISRDMSFDNKQPVINTANSIFGGDTNIVTPYVQKEIVLDKAILDASSTGNTKASGKINYSDILTQPQPIESSRKKFTNNLNRRDKNNVIITESVSEGTPNINIKIPDLSPFGVDNGFPGGNFGMINNMNSVSETETNNKQASSQDISNSPTISQTISKHSIQFQASGNLNNDPSFGKSKKFESVSINNPSHTTFNAQYDTNPVHNVDKTISASDAKLNDGMNVHIDTTQLNQGTNILPKTDYKVPSLVDSNPVSPTVIPTDLTTPHLHDLVAEGIYPFEGSASAREFTLDQGLPLVNDLNAAIIKDHTNYEILHTEPIHHEWLVDEKKATHPTSTNININGNLNKNINTYLQNSGNIGVMTGESVPVTNLKKTVDSATLITNNDLTNKQDISPRVDVMGPTTLTREQSVKPDVTGVLTGESLPVNNFDTVYSASFISNTDVTNEQNRLPKVGSLSGSSAFTREQNINHQDTGVLMGESVPITNFQNTPYTTNSVANTDLTSTHNISPTIDAIMGTKKLSEEHSVKPSSVSSSAGLAFSLDGNKVSSEAVVLSVDTSGYTFGDRIQTKTTGNSNFDIRNSQSGNIDFAVPKDTLSTKNIAQNKHSQPTGSLTLLSNTVLGIDEPIIDQNNDALFGTNFNFGLKSDLMANTQTISKDSNVPVVNDLQKQNQNSADLMGMSSSFGFKLNPVDIVSNDHAPKEGTSESINYQTDAVSVGSNSNFGFQLNPTEMGTNVQTLSKDYNVPVVNDQQTLTQNSAVTSSSSGFKFNPTDMASNAHILSKVGTSESTNYQSDTALVGSNSNSGLKLNPTDIGPDVHIIAKDSNVPVETKTQKQGQKDVIKDKAVLNLKTDMSINTFGDSLINSARTGEFSSNSRNIGSESLNNDILLDKTNINTNGLTASLISLNVETPNTSNKETNIDSRYSGAVSDTSYIQGTFNIDTSVQGDSSKVGSDNKASPIVPLSIQTGVTFESNIKLPTGSEHAPTGSRKNNTTNTIFESSRQSMSNTDGSTFAISDTMSGKTEPEKTQTIISGGESMGFILGTSDSTFTADTGFKVPMTGSNGAPLTNMDGVRPSMNPPANANIGNKKTDQEATANRIHTLSKTAGSDSNSGFAIPFSFGSFSRSSVPIGGSQTTGISNAKTETYQPGNSNLAGGSFVIGAGQPNPKTILTGTVPASDATASNMAISGGGLAIGGKSGASVFDSNAFSALNKINAQTETKQPIQSRQGMNTDTSFAVDMSAFILPPSPSDPSMLDSSSTNVNSPASSEAASFSTKIKNVDFQNKANLEQNRQRVTIPALDSTSSSQISRVSEATVKNVSPFKALNMNLLLKKTPSPSAGIKPVTNTQSQQIINTNTDWSSRMFRTPGMTGFGVLPTVIKSKTVDASPKVVNVATSAGSSLFSFGNTNTNKGVNIAPYKPINTETAQSQRLGLPSAPDVDFMTTFLNSGPLGVGTGNKQLQNQRVQIIPLEKMAVSTIKQRIGETLSNTGVNIAKPASDTATVNQFGVADIYTRQQQLNPSQWKSFLSSAQHEQTGGANNRVYKVQNIVGTGETRPLSASSNTATISSSSAKDSNLLNMLQKMEMVQVAQKELINQRQSAMDSQKLMMETADQLSTVFRPDKLSVLDSSASVFDGQNTLARNAGNTGGFTFRKINVDRPTVITSLQNTNAQVTTGNTGSMADTGTMLTANKRMPPTSQPIYIQQALASERSGFQTSVNNQVSNEGMPSFGANSLGVNANARTIQTSQFDPSLNRNSQTSTGIDGSGFTVGRSISLGNTSPISFFNGGFSSDTTVTGGSNNIDPSSTRLTLGQTVNRQTSGNQNNFLPLSSQAVDPSSSSLLSRIMVRQPDQTRNIGLSTNSKFTTTGNGVAGTPTSSIATQFTSGNRLAVFGSGTNSAGQTLGTRVLSTNSAGSAGRPIVDNTYACKSTIKDPNSQVHYYVTSGTRRFHFRCAIGTAYDPSTCGCSAFTTQSSDCLEVHMDFNNGKVEDSSYNSLPIWNENVEVTNRSTPLTGIALFGGDGKLTIWKYQNYDFRDHIMLKVQFRPGPGGDLFQPLISNCDSTGPSVAIIYDRVNSQVHLLLKTVNVTHKNLTFNVNPDKWNDVTYIYDGQEFIGIVNGVRRYVSRDNPHLLSIIGGEIKAEPTTGVIEIRDAAFVLGHCPKYGSFVGAMVDIQIYTCIPKDFRLE